MTTVTDDRAETGTPPTADRTATVAEAAAALGVTPDAVRARIRRGTLEAVKHEGEWVVTLPIEEHDAGQESDRAQPDTDNTASGLIDQLRSENEYLRDRLSDMIRQAATERERADVLQREALQRLEALTAGGSPRQEASESPQSAGNVSPGSAQGVDTNAPQSGALVRLWHWLKGG